MKILETSIRSKLGRRPAKRFSRGSFMISVLGAAIALTACATNPTAQQPGTNSTAATETVAASGADSLPVDSSLIDTPRDSSPADSSAEGSSKTYAEDGVAISGADPVAYFTDEAYVPGSADYTYEWQGTTWQFVSSENRDLFAANPEQYAPEYGGFCAWAVAAKKTLVPTDPNAWSVVDDKLYLNANQKVQSNWIKDIPGFIAQANSNWPSLSQ